MSRRWACALLIFCADLLIGAAHWPHFTGGSLLLILVVDALLAFVLLGLPALREAWRHQAQMIALPEDTAAVAARRQFIADIQRANDDSVFRTVASMRGES